MGGLEDDGNSGVIGANSKAIAGPYAAGKFAGGIHGNNRLGGNSRRDCVAFGRATGKHASKFVLGEGVATLSLKTLSGGGLPGDVVNSKLTGGPREDNTSKGAAAASGGGGGGDGYSLADVAKHTTKNDCRVVVNREVLNATSPSTLSGCRFSPRAS